MKEHATLRYRGDSLLDESKISRRELLGREQTRTRDASETKYLYIYERHHDEEESGIVAGYHLSSSCSRVLSALIRLLFEIAERLKVIEQQGVSAIRRAEELNFATLLQN